MSDKKTQVSSDLELGVIGNCQIAALVDGGGRVVWGSFPRMDSDPAFCSLLDPTAAEPTPGCFEIELVNFKTAEQAYVENTAILTTTLRDHNGGAVKIIDFAPRYTQFGRSYHPVMIVRNIVPVSGSPAVRIRLRPAAGYGARHAQRSHGSSHIRYSNDSYTIRLTTNAPISAILEERTFVLERSVALILGPDESLRDDPDKACRDMYGETKSYWEGWSRALSIPFEWQDEVIRAAITLKLCTFEDTGAVLAALTTSIPEAHGSGRNWDYRYCWLRDSFFTVQALNRLGATRTMMEFLRYLFNLVAERDSDAPLQPVYGISGQAELEERQIESLAGYRGMGPVRIGNDAYRQQQHDVYGATVLAATQSFFDRRMVERAREQDVVRLEALGAKAAALFDQPDAGPWEYRGRSVVHTYSSVMCWAACDRLARITAHLGANGRAADWAQRAAKIRAQILEASWSERRKRLRRELRRRAPRCEPADTAGARVHCRPTIRDSRARWRRSSASSSRGRISTVTRTRTTSVCPRPRSTSARSGTSTHWRLWDARTRRASSIRTCSRGARVWACYRRTWTSPPESYGAISRRPTAWSASSWVRCV